MSETIVQQIARWVVDCSFDRLPADVVLESKRILLDSIGCAFSGLEDSKGTIGLAMGRHLGGQLDEATILGTGERASVWGAAFANGELINAIDFDHILPPGHVAPYVLPVVLAVGEAVGASGKDLIVGLAIAHELSNRLGKAMDYLRDVKDGQLDTPKVYGYASTIFGAVASAAKLRGLSVEQIANALGIAGSVSPVNSHMAWVMHTPTTTVKYTVAGAMTNAALTALYMGELGHRGDLLMLDDAEYGFARLVGSKRWEKDRIVDGLGERWGFVPESSFKPYPHCRVLHALLDAQTAILDQHDIRPEEIEAIRIWVEGFVERPLWLNTDITRTGDAQFSMAHGMAVGAHRIRPGKAWQKPETVFDPAVLALMRKVTPVVHPDYVKLLSENAASRPARVEITARGQVFANERRYPKGSPSPDPQSYMTDEELVDKFTHNCEDVLPATRATQVAAMIMALEEVSDIRPLIRSLGRGETQSAAA